MSKMKTFVLLCAVLMLLGACKGVQEDALSGSPAGTVTLIIGDCPEQMTTNRFGSSIRQGGYATLSYIDAAGELALFEPRRSGRDTLVIPTWGGYAEIRHLYSAIEFDPYLLKEGDRVLVTYGPDGRPFLTSLTAESNTEVYNMPYTLPESIQWRGYHIGTVMTDPQFTKVYEYFQDPAAQARFPSLREKFADRFVDLDSLSQVRERYLAELNRQTDVWLADGRIEPAYAEFLRQRFVPDAALHAEDVVGSDSLLHYISNYAVALDYDPDGTLPARFDRIAKDTALSELARKGILKSILNRMIDGDSGFRPYPRTVTDRYAEQYVEMTGDTSFVQNILSAPVSLSGPGLEMAIEDSDGQAVTLAAFLSENRGKVIYVDIWASWCAPCRGQMPYSRALQKQLAGEDVVFLFLSTDRKRQDWLKAVGEEGDVMPHSYRVVDSDAAFLDEIRLSTIPRYLIFDKSGTLRNADAPRPSSEAIAQELLRLAHGR